MRKLIVCNIMSLDGYYTGFKSFWPAVADDPDAPPTLREISRLNNAIDKVVISDSLTPEETEPWRSTRIISRADARGQFEQLKRQSGNDILVFGSHRTWNGLLGNDLVDELHLMVGAVLLGEGTPIFEGKPAVSLRPIDTRRWDDSDNMLVRYKVRLTRSK